MDGRWKRRATLTGAEQAQARRLERAKGIEPSYAAWEAAVLPLNYARETSIKSGRSDLFWPDLEVARSSTVKPTDLPDPRFICRLRPARQALTVPMRRIGDRKSTRLN